VEKGSFTFVLHSHLPYVIGHGEWPHGMDWLYEAAVETYLPLFTVLKAIVDDGIQPAITLGITPVLMEQLAHPRFKEGFQDYVYQKIESAKYDQLYFQELKKPNLSNLADYWKNFYESIQETFNEIEGDLLTGFRSLKHRSGMEIITSAATHGYFPLLGTDESISAQVAVGIQTFEKYMDHRPKGIWLPECAYRPAYSWSPPIGGSSRQRAGVEEILYEHGLEYFIVDKHLIVGGENRGVYLDRFTPLKTLWSNFSRGWNPPPEQKNRSVFKPYLVSSTGTERAVAAFGRHEESALQVWSAEWGYPGNPAYLDFHKKHFPGGHKYWRVTSREATLGEKDLYHPEWIEDSLEEQAEHFVNLIVRYLETYKNETGEKGLITAPFDTELFGHWWFEGPQWLNKVLRKLPEKGVTPTSCGKYLETNPPQETISLIEGSWGKGGFHYIWLNDWTEWTWREIYSREEQFRQIVDTYSEKRDAFIQRLLKQMARELLLLEASDWQFLISTWSARDYAEDRVNIHIQRFDELNTILNNCISDKKIPDYAQERLNLLENEDSIFFDIQIQNWKSRNPQDSTDVPPQ